MPGFFPNLHHPFCRRYYCEVIYLSCLFNLILGIFIYLVDFRYYKIITQNPACRTADFTTKASYSSLEISGLETIENVTIYYRKEPAKNRCPLIEGRRVLISYASECCERSQLINCQTGLEIGGFDLCVLFGPNSIDPYLRDKFIKPMRNLGTKRGNGFWAWKPAIILKTLLAISEKDILFYADSGSEFIENFEYELFCFQQQVKHDVTLFSLNHFESNWTKFDTFILTGCESEQICMNTPQIMASFLLLRKSFFSIQFISTWLAYATDPRAITDIPSTLVPKESPFYIDHRHDQSILSLLAKKWGIASHAFVDPTEFGNEMRLNNKRNLSATKQLIYHSRSKT